MNPKIAHFGRERIEFDLTGMDRKSIKRVLNVVMGRAEDSDEWLALLTGEKKALSYHPHQKDFDRGGGFEMTTVETDYVVPYLDRLKEWTGFEFPIGAEVPLVAMNDIYHTHGVMSAKMTFAPNPYKSFQGSDEGPILRRLSVESYTHVFLNSNEKEINDSRRKEKAVQRCLQYINEFLGKVEVPREYIETGNGLFKHNPNYASGRPMPIHKGACSESVWQEIFGYWFERHATEGQKAIVARMSHPWGGDKLDEKFPTLRDYNGIHCDDYNTSVTIAQFKASEVPPKPKTKGAANAGS